MRIINYFRDSIAELRKVAWPDVKQTREYTLVVVVISLAVAAFLGLADYLLELLLKGVL